MQVKELVQQLDPLITPILNPFVEGVQAPINKVGHPGCKIFPPMSGRLQIKWAGFARVPRPALPTSQMPT